MSNSDTTSGHIKVCSNAYHEAAPLYNECKDNLLLSSNSYKKSLDCEGHQELREINNNSHNSLLYLSNISNTIMEDIHPEIFRKPIGEAIRLAKKKFADYRQIEPKRLNWMISRIHSEFDNKKPISHIVITKLYDKKHPGISIYEANCIGLDDPNEYRKDCEKALMRAGDDLKGYLFGIEQGANGLWHIHALVQGWLRQHNFVLARTGYGYIKFPEDRNEYFNIDEDIPKRIRGFHATAKYCLEKHHPHKKAYLKISS